MLKPFEQKFGVRVVHDATGTASQDYAKIRAARGAPGFDVAGLLTPPEMILGAREKMLEPITEREVPNLRHAWPVAPRIIGNVGVAHTLQYCALIYQKEKIERPASWADYWQPEKRYGDRIKGHVINYNPANLLSVYALIHAAQLGGGGVDNMEPAWERLRAQKPYVGVMVTGSTEAVPYFENGEVWISPYWSARSGYYIARGLPFDMVVPQEGVIGLFDCAAVPVGAKNKKLAYEFLNFRLEPEVQRAFSLAYFSSPGRGDRRTAAGVRPHPDHHRRADRQGAVPRLRSDRATPARLDAALAGDHGLARACPAKVGAGCSPACRRCFSSHSSRCRTRCC